MSFAEFIGRRKRLMANFNSEFRSNAVEVTTICHKTQHFSENQPSKIVKLSACAVCCQKSSVLFLTHCVVHQRIENKHHLRPEIMRSLRKLILFIAALSACSRVCCSAIAFGAFDTSHTREIVDYSSRRQLSPSSLFGLYCYLSMTIFQWGAIFIF